MFTRPSPLHPLGRPLFSFLPTTRSPFIRTRKGSFNANDFSTSSSPDGAGLPKDGAPSEGGAGAKEQQSGAAAERRGEPAAGSPCAPCALPPAQGLGGTPRAGTSGTGWKGKPRKLHFLKDKDTRADPF